MKTMLSWWKSLRIDSNRRKRRPLAVEVRPLEEREVPAAGFQLDTVLDGFSPLLAVRFGEDGKVWAAEKSGIVKVFDNLNDNTPTIVLDLRRNVHNYWDRGLNSIALDPNFSTNPYLYALYTYDADIGGQAPKYGTGNFEDDNYPDPTQPGSSVSARLSRFRVNANMTVGAEQVLIEDWPQQFVSHSIGNIGFGPDGALYVSAGDGASFNSLDYGQFGNPFNDPALEGGTLRSQDLLSPGDPVGLDGTIIRVDPATGQALPSNPLSASTDPNARRIIAHGLRNPFRFTFRPGTTELWVGDVGWDSWEEINRIPNAAGASVNNFGWPAYEGPNRQPGYDAADLPLLEGLYASGNARSPYYSYAHGVPIVPGSGEDFGGSSISGLAFYNGTTFPAAYQNALFFSDYSRNQIFVMKAGGDGLPNTSQVEAILPGQLNHPIDLQVGPDGNLYYIDVFAGRLQRISYTEGNRNPIPVMQATPSSGTAPLTVQFNASQSYDTDPGDTLTFLWDLEGDGHFHAENSGVTQSFTYTTPGTYNVRLQVTDNNGGSSIITKQIVVTGQQNGLTAFIDLPTTLGGYAIGDAVAFSGRATDINGNLLPSSALTWTVDMIHGNLFNPQDTHVHRISTFTGIASGSFNFPDHEFPSHVELTLTASQNGQVSSKKIRIDARIIDIQMMTNVPGITLSLDGEALPAPFTRQALNNSIHTISAPTLAVVGGQQYRFLGWSDGVTSGIRSITANGNQSFTANFQLVPSGGPEINYPSGFTGGVSGLLTLNNGAAVVGSNLRLTENANFQARGVFTTAKIGIGSFRTEFVYRATSAFADGLAFVIQGVGPTAQGYGGGGLGFGGLANSVAIKLDLYNNDGEGESSTGLYLNGADAGALGSFDLTPSGIALRNANPKRVVLTYDGTNLLSTVTDTVTGATFTRSYAVNIASFVGGTTAHVGFTASTGGANATQEIQSWTYTTNTSLPGQPTNVGVALSGYTGASTTATPLVATISWTASASANGYRVERRLAGASAFTPLATIASAATTTYADGSVVAGLTYEYRVVAFNGNGDGPASAIVTQAVPAIPGAPFGLTAVATNSTTVNLTWTDDATNETGYQILRSTAGGAFTLLAVVPAGSGTMTYADTALTAGTTYGYRVQAFNLAGASAVTTASVTTPSSGSTPIVNFPSGFPNTAGLTITGPALVTGNALRLTDLANFQTSGVFTTAKVSTTQFRTEFVYRATSAFADGLAFVWQGVGPTALGYSGGGLGYGGIGQSVAIKLDLYDNYGEGTSSTGLFLNGVDPSIPGSFDLLASGIDLRNTNPKRVVLVYDGSNLTQTVTDTVTSATFTRAYAINIPATAGATAHVGFTAATGGANAVQEILNWTYSTTTSQPSVPGAPTGVSGAISGYVATSTSAVPLVHTVSWNAVPSATGYRVERRFAGTGSFSPLTTINSASTTVFADTTVVPGTTYDYRVIAFNAAGDGNPSTTLSTAMPSVPAAPTGLVATATGQTTISLTWTDVANNEVGYQVFRSTGGGAFTLLASTTGNSFADGGLTAATTYNYRVQAFNLAGPSTAATATGTTNSGSTAGSINFATGFPNTTGLTITGSASNIGNRLRLTGNVNTQRSSVFSTTKVRVNQFRTEFTFQNTNAQADGFAFVIQGVGANAQGYGGGGLAYGGIGQSVAIKFDIYDNSGEGTSSTGMYLNGAEPAQIGASNLLTSGIDLRNANVKRVVLTYDGATLTQTVIDTVTGATFTRMYSVNIPTLVGGTTAHVGFTASTGGANATQEITAWSFTPTGN